MIQEKMTRIRPHLSSCKFSLLGSFIAIHDELGIITDIEELIQAYGMKSVKLINENFNHIKGNVYIITDELMQLFDVVKGDANSISELLSKIYIEDVDLKNIIQLYDYIKTTQQITNEFKSLSDNQYLNKMINSIHQNKTIKIEKVEQSIVREYDGNIISSEVISSRSDEKEYLHAERELRDAIQKTNTNHKSNIVQGTTKSIEIRAKKLGYSVIKKKNDEIIQLVLVRGR